MSWRNASLNDVPLPDGALARLQLYAIPSSGRLKLDYVSYQVRLPVLPPAVAGCRRLQVSLSRAVGRRGVLIACC